MKTSKTKPPKIPEALQRELKYRRSEASTLLLLGQLDQLKPPAGCMVEPRTLANILEDYAKREGAFMQNTETKLADLDYEALCSTVCDPASTRDQSWTALQDMCNGINAFLMHRSTDEDDAEDEDRELVLVLAHICQHTVRVL